MASCRFRRICAFFQNEMEYMPGTAGLYRDRYCHKASSKCARYAIFRAAGREAVPPDLFPYQHDRAVDILAGLSPRVSA